MPTKKRHPYLRGTSYAGFAIVLSVFATVIWIKLRLVGGVPRTAYAEPEEDRRAEPKVQVEPSTQHSRLEESE